MIDGKTIVNGARRALEKADELGHGGENIKFGNCRISEFEVANKTQIHVTALEDKDIDLAGCKKKLGNGTFIWFRGFENVNNIHSDIFAAMCRNLHVNGSCNIISATGTGNQINVTSELNVPFKITIDSDIVANGRLIETNGAPKVKGIMLTDVRGKQEVLVIDFSIFNGEMGEDNEGFLEALDMIGMTYSRKLGFHKK